MGIVKTAYELANERIIAPCHYLRDEPEKKKIDFVEIAEFSDREDRVLESNESKLIEDPEEVRNKKDEPMSTIRVQEAETIHVDDTMEVYWNGNFLDYGGFARMNRTMVFGLSNRGVKVKVETEPYLVHVNKSTQSQLQELSNLSISSNAPKIFGVTIPINLSHTGKKILYTMIETSEKVHKDYAEKLNLMNEIWVATEYGRRIMRKSNVCVPIYVMPLGVDIERYKPDCGVMDFGSAMRGFRFLSVFRWSYRKGFDILLRAFMEEFSAEDDVSLLMVSRNMDKPEAHGSNRIVEDFNGIKGSIGKSESDLPHIALYTKPIDEKDMPKVYNSCDAFVLISRGEGFGLPYCEAAACGLPVIGTNCSGQSDFLKADNSFLVEPDGFVEARVGGTLSNMAKLCHFYEGQVFPDFSSNAINQTRAHMRFIYENYQKAKEKAAKLQNLIVHNYTWDMAIDKVYSRIGELQ